MKNIRDNFKKKIFIISLLLFFPLLLFSFRAHAGSIKEVAANIEHLKLIKPPFTFAILGDSRDGEKVYLRLMNEILERKPDFIVHLGDMVSKPREKEWRHFFEISKSVNLPFFPAAGNHDVGVTAQGEERYRKKFILPEGKPYYTFRAGGGLFIFLDSEKDQGKIVDDQWRWLDHILSSSDDAFKMVFLHRPLFLPMDSFKKGRAMDKYPSDRDRLHQLFVKANVKAVFAGDDHRYDRREKDGILYLISGGGGAPLHPFKEGGGYFHYVQVSVHTDQIKGEVVDLGGQIRDRFVVKP